MEALIAVLRPNCDILSRVVGDPQFYDIDILRDDGKLLSISMLLDVEPAQVLCNHLYAKTGGDAGGLKGKRAIYVPPTTSSSGALYCIPVDKTDQINTSLTSEKMSFYPLDKWFEYNLRSKPCPNAWCSVASRLKNWIAERYSIPGALALFFSSSSDDRFKWSISNPAFVETHIQFTFNSPNSLQSNYNQRDTLAHMESYDRCDITKNNPVFGSNLSFKYKVDKIILNRCWGLKKSDTSVNSASPDLWHFEPSFMSDTAGGKFLKQSHPLHFFVRNRNIEGVRNCLKEGCSVLQRNEYFETPIHLAAVIGDLRILELMLDETLCNVNISNHLQQSLLHVAVINGKVHVVECLLKRGADMQMKDKYGKTALNYCEDVNSVAHETCYKLLRRQIEQLVGTIDVYLMDSTCVRLHLVSQADTSVAQLHEQMMNELKLPNNCAHLFTIWICSKNLQLQLKPEHRPIQQLNNWKRVIVGKLTDQPPELEDPELYWKRCVLLPLREESAVTNPIAINLLYLEAYHNYIKSLYLCTYHDVVLLAGILMQLFFGDFKEPCEHFLKKPQLFGSLIPFHMLVSSSRVNLAQHIREQYKAYSEKCANKSVAVHQTHFLKICRFLTTYASAFFTGYKYSKNRVKSPIFIGVNDVGIHIITVSPREMVKSFLYKDVEWGFVQAANWPELQIKIKSNKQPPYVYLTKQAGLINNLMKKLYEMSNSASPQILYEGL